MSEYDEKDIETAAAEENVPAEGTLNEAQKKLKRKNEIVRVVKFVLLSASAGVIQLVSFTILNELAFRGVEEGVGYWVPYLISLVLSVVWNFTFNRKFTFKSAANVPKAMLLVFLYYLVFTPCSTLWGDALTDRAGWNEYIVLILTMLVNMITEFLYTRFVVYRKSINTNELGKKEEAQLKAAGVPAETEQSETASKADPAETDGDEK